MLQNNISVFFHFLDGCIIIFQNGNATRIVVGCRTFSARSLCESFRQIKTEAIHLIFLQQELQVALHKLTHQWTFMIKVMEHTIRMRRLHIEVWIVLCCLITIPIKFGQRIISCSMIINHIQNNCHTGLMTSVNELLIHCFCPISLIHREEKTRIIPPTVITVKLLYRHQLNGIDTHFLQVRKLSHRTIYVAGGGKVAQVQFVYHQLLRICYLKAIGLPIITVFLYLEGRNDSYSSFRISHTFVIGRS